MDAKDQHKRVAKTERAWATEALKDAQYNKQQAKRDLSMGNIVLAHMHQREAGWDTMWMNRRLRIARAEQKKSR
jgi:hypothetical protein